MSNRETKKIRVRGLVQGVGFRPTVWKYAKAHGIVGDVSNDAEGVLIHARASAAEIEEFIKQLESNPPPLARIDSIERSNSDCEIKEGVFHIIESRTGHVQTGVIADAATCSACRRDIESPKDRRYRYAFTNCTHCGPRLSIVRSIPYDRANTSMGVFEQCAACLSEY